MNITLDSPAKILCDEKVLILLFRVSNLERDKYIVIKLYNPLVTHCCLENTIDCINMSTDYIINTSSVPEENKLKADLTIEAGLNEDNLLGEVIEQGTIILGEDVFNLSINDLITLIHQKLNKRELENE